MKYWCGLLICLLAIACLIASASAACVLQSAGELTAKLTWTNVDPVTSDTVNILRSNTAGAETLLITIPYGTTFTDTVPAPTASISYFYKVQSAGPGGVSLASNEACKSFQPGPAAPTSLQVQ